MKKLLLFIMCIFIFCLCAQTHTYHVNSNIKCSWNPVRDTDLSHYNFYSVAGTDTNVFVVIDTTFALPDIFLEEGYMFFGIQSVDSSGNASIVNWAQTQCTWTEYECWQVRVDTTKPESPVSFVPMVTK